MAKRYTDREMGWGEERRIQERRRGEGQVFLTGIQEFGAVEV